MHVGKFSLHFHPPKMCVSSNDTHQPSTSNGSLGVIFQQKICVADFNLKFMCNIMAMLVAINMSIYESMNIIPSLSRFFPSFGSSETITFHYMPLLNTLWPKPIDPLGGNIRKYLDGHCTEKKREQAGDTGCRNFWRRYQCNDIVCVFVHI